MMRHQVESGYELDRKLSAFILKKETLGSRIMEGRCFWFLLEPHAQGGFDRIERSGGT